MIVANCIGGMCNRFFIMAAAYGHTKKVKARWAIKSYLANEFPALQYLNGTFISTDDNFTKYQEKSFRYSPIEGNYIELHNSYFQSYKYYDHCIDEIRELFSPCEELKKLITKWKGDTCAIHVRRGDYLNLSQYHFNLGLDYYEQAMEIMGKKKYIVFSNDIAWCKEQSLFKGCIFYQGGDGSRTWEDLKDFYSMSGCNNFILSNSTFPYWASELNQNKEKVIAPKNWFGERKRHLITSDLYREEMIVI